MKRFKVVLGCLTILAVIIALTNVGLWLSGHDELAIAMLVGVTAFVSVIVSSAWSALLLKTGAELALRSQESNDERDIAQIQAATGLVKVLMRQEEKAQSQQPKFPMPEQRNWLPQYEEGEFEELN